MNKFDQRTISRIALVFVAAIGVFALLAGSFAAGHATPTNTCPTVESTQKYTFLYGVVTFDGTPAPPGSVVEARNPRGDTVGCEETTDTGEYPLMYVYGEETINGTPIPGMKSGEEIAFVVDGVPATPNPVPTWSNDWSSHEVDLSVSGEPPTVGPDSVSVTGPAAGLVQSSYTFTATVAPASVTTPLTYTWEATGQATVIHTDSSSDHIVFDWSTSRSKSVTVTVENNAGTAVDSHTINIYKPVSAGFLATTTEGPASLTVDFSNTSSGDYNTCSWDFGDGNTSTDCNNPSHSYANPGRYDVSLTVDGPGGSDTVTKLGLITVYEPAQAGFSASPTFGLTPLTVAFTDTSTGAYDSRLWRFGDGSSSTSATPGHSYTSAGEYTVSLEVSGPGGTDTLTRTNYVTVADGDNVLEVGPTSGGTLVVTDTDGLAATIEVPPGAVGHNTVLVYSDVSMVMSPHGFIFANRAFDLVAYQNGIKQTDFVFQKPIDITISYLDGDVSHTDEEALTLLYQEQDTWVDAATTCSPSSTYNRDTTNNTVGVSICHLTRYGLFGPVIAPSSIDIEGPADGLKGDTLPFTATVSSASVTTPLTYTWKATGKSDVMHTDGVTDSASFSWNSSGTKMVTVTAANDGGQITTTHTVEIHTPVYADFTATPTLGAAPITVAFTNTSAGDYTSTAWDFGDGNTSSLENPSHRYTTAGSYTVVLTVTGPWGEDTRAKISYIAVEQADEEYDVYLPAVIR